MLSELSDRQWLWASAGFYLVGFLIGLTSLIRRGRPSSALIYAVILAGYALQLAGLGLRGKAVGGCPIGNKFEILQFTAWSAISLYLLVGVTFRSSILGLFTAALAALLTLSSLSIPGWDATHRIHIFGGNPWIEFHAALALFSYGVFGLLALTSAMFLFRNHSLKVKRLHGWFSFLPSILDLDAIGVRLLAFGVALLAAALLVGFVYWGKAPESVGLVKLFVTAAVWVAYAVALILRAKGTLLSKRFAWTCLALFAAALLSLGPVDSSRHPASDAVRTVRS